MVNIQSTPLHFKKGCHCQYSSILSLEAISVYQCWGQAPTLPKSGI